MSLTALASVSGGVLFALTFANLVRYISVENALEQAVQRIARCINPTDAACTQTAPPSGDRQYDWYLNTESSASTSWADRYDYSARIYREDWELSFPAYEVHKVKLPPVTYTERGAPIPGMSYERRTAHIAAIFDPLPKALFTPAFSPNFPEFDPAYERDRRDQDPWLWTPRALDVRGDVRRAPGSGRYVSREVSLAMESWSSGLLRLSDEGVERRAGTDNVAEFVTGWVEVPLLDAGGLDPECVGDCDVTYASGGSESRWFDRAYVAVKAFAVARRVSGNPEVKWAGSGTPDDWGLQLEYVSRDHWQAAAAQARALGVPVSSIAVGEMDFECLGGRDWSDVERTNEWKNFHLVLRGAVKLSPTTNKPDESTGVDPACPNADRRHWDLSVERGGAYRIRGFLKVRGGTIESEVMLRSYFDNYRRAEPAGSPFVCETEVPLTANSEPSCKDACRKLLPNPDDYDDEPRDCRVDVVAAVGCDDGRAEVTFKPSGDYGDASACPAAKRVAEYGGAATGFHWGTAEEFSPPRWRRSLSPEDEAGILLADPEVVRPADHILKNSAPVFARRDVTWHPPLEAFGLTPEEAEQLAANANYSLSSRARSSVEAAGVYPFSRTPEFEIPSFLPNAASLTSCSGATAPLDERLRAYAANEFPAAGDPDVLVETSAVYVDSVPIGIQDGCGEASGKRSDVPACTTVSYLEQEATSCGAPKYLGRFSAAELPNGPGECAEKGATCFSSALLEATPEEPGAVAVNYELARARGYSEIERALPGSRRGCAAEGCAEFEFESGTSPETSVIGRYHMPLSFPLDVIFGKRTLAVEKQKVELPELAVAGRTDR